MTDFDEMIKDIENARKSDRPSRTGVLTINVANVKGDQLKAMIKKAEAVGLEVVLEYY